METFRLKNIAILILALLNGFLLLLLGYQYLQDRRAETDAAGQLEELYAAHQLSLGSQVDLTAQSLSPLVLSRHSETEQAIAAYLLGSETASASQGGGIYSYTGQYGALQFRSGGSFDGGSLSLPVEDPEAFAQDFCGQFGYGDLQMRREGDADVAAAVQYVAGVPISGCDVKLTFRDGVLSAVSGAHVSLEDAAADTSAPQMTCVTALVRFLDHRSVSGIVCSEVTGVACVYALQNAASLRLLPMWRIDTDVYTYFVDCATGEISRY